MVCFQCDVSFFKKKICHLLMFCKIVLSSDALFFLLIFFCDQLILKCMCFFVRYEGLSDKFLSCPVQKILLLAGTDRLDRFVMFEYEELSIFQSMFMMFTQHLISSPFASDSTHQHSMFCCLSVARDWACKVSLQHIYFMNFSLSAVDYH